MTTGGMALATAEDNYRLIKTTGSSLGGLRRCRPSIGSGRPTQEALLYTQWSRAKAHLTSRDPTEIT